MSITVLSDNNRLNALLSTFKWGAGHGEAVALTVSYPNVDSTWVADYLGGEPFAPYRLVFFNTQQQQAARQALALWADVANIGFTEVNDNNEPGDLRFAYSTAVDNDGSAAWAYLPSTGAVVAEAGDIWFATTESDLNSGSSGFNALLHEIGHALGLKHPFAPESGNNALLPAAENSTQWTVMAYNDYRGAGWVEQTPGSFVKRQVTTPMLYDILAMQFLYGANRNTRSDDDVYRFSDDQAVLQTIWDAGGNDTLDLSNQRLPVTVDLHAGAFSSVGPMNYELRNGVVFSTDKTAVDNIAIAFDVEIENVIGGRGDDFLQGNALANQLTGNAGNDQLSGGAGQDTAIFAGKRADYALKPLAQGLQLTDLAGDDGRDVLVDIEFLQFADQLLETETLLTVNTLPTTPADVETRPLEGDVNHINYFLLQISQALAVDASVNFSTRSGTALAGEDFVATSGVASIAAGKTSTVIGVEIIGDTRVESDETFFLVISNPQGGIFPNTNIEIIAARTIIDDDGVF